MDLVNLQELLHEPHLRSWPSMPAEKVGWAEALAPGKLPPLNMNSSVLALIPHYRCEQYLEACIQSLVAQTHPLDGIVVIDDCSNVPPLEIVEKFPQVTLVRAIERVGPYRLKQEVINSTAYDAYLLQDADDWSADTRLELLLEEAERTGADIVGSQEIRIYCDRGEIKAIDYPGDVNAALAPGQPDCDPLLHPTCLLSREILMRLGGFATGLHFGADAEFLLRATYAARMVNIPYYSYFRRRRSESLTGAEATGIRSPARRELAATLDARGKANEIAFATGKAPDLAPYPMAGPVGLLHLTGPQLRSFRQ